MRWSSGTLVDLNNWLGMSIDRRVQDMAAGVAAMLGNPLDAPGACHVFGKRGDRTDPPEERAFTHWCRQPVCSRGTGRSACLSDEKRTGCSIR